MWMDAYVEEILLRERIADGQRRAARNHALGRPQSSRARDIREVLSRLLRRRTPHVPREAVA